MHAALARHGVDVRYRLLQGHGLSGRIWYATSPPRLFSGEPRLRTRAIERFVATGEPPLGRVVQIVLKLVGQHLDILRELAERRRDANQ